MVRTSRLHSFVACAVAAVLALLVLAVPGRAGAEETLLDPIDLEDVDQEGTGWSWDADAATLTLDNCDLRFASTGFHLSGSGDISIVVNGACSIVSGIDPHSSENGRCIIFSLSSSSNATITSADGTRGSLLLADLKESALIYESAITFLGNAAQLNITNVDISLTGQGSGVATLGTPVVMDNATISGGTQEVEGEVQRAPQKYIISTNSTLALRNGSAITGTAAESSNAIQAIQGLTVQDSTIDVELLVAEGTNSMIRGVVISAIGVTGGKTTVENSDVTLEMVLTDEALTNLNFAGMPIVGILSQAGFSLANSNVSVAISMGSIPTAAYGLYGGGYTIDTCTVSSALSGGSAAGQFFEILADSGEDQIALSNCKVRRGTVWSGVLDGDGLTILSESDVANGESACGTALISPIASDAGVEGVTVAGTPASLTDDGFAVELPAGSALPGATDIAVAPTDANATVSTPVSSDGGSTWTFTVTAEDGVTTATYALKVSVAVAPAPGPSVSETPEPEAPAPETPSPDPAAGQGSVGGGRIPSTGDAASVAPVVAILAGATLAGAVALRRSSIHG